MDGIQSRPWHRLTLAAIAALGIALSAIVAVQFSNTQIEEKRHQLIVEVTGFANDLEQYLHGREMIAKTVGAVFEAPDLSASHPLGSVGKKVLALTPEISVPIEQGRLLASLIPNSRFVQLDTENHMPLADEPAWPRLVDEMRRFLAEPAAAPTNSRNALPLGELTSRERAVLEGIAEGLDNTEIAASLGLSEKTVRNHITRVFDKIGVEHRYEAIVRARDAGLGMKSRLTGAR